MKISEYEIDNQAAYTTNIEHLTDELRRLDLIIGMCLLQAPNKCSDHPWDPFKGLVLSEEEVSGLLANDDKWLNDKCNLSSDDSEYQKLENALNQLETQIQSRQTFSLEEGVYLTMPHLVRLFGLTAFEERCMIICLAPELDRKYEKLYAYMQDDVTRKSPSVDLVLSLCCRSREEKLKARLAFDPRASLLKYRLLSISPSAPDTVTPLLTRILIPDPRIVNFTLGFGGMDVRLKSVARWASSQTNWDQVMTTEEVKDRMRGFILSHFRDAVSGGQNVVFYLRGPYGAGKRAIAEAACKDLGIPLIIGDVDGMLRVETPFEEMIWLLGRETVMQSAALYLENFDGPLIWDHGSSPLLMRLLETVRTFSRLTFLFGDRPWMLQGAHLRTLLGNTDAVFIDLELPALDDAARRDLWEIHFNEGCRVDGDVDPDALADKFRFTPGRIQDALTTARNLALWRSPGDGRITMQDLYTACRAQSNQKLDSIARKIEPKYYWNDIVLPADQMDQLDEICNQVKKRHIVYGKWGFDRKLSLGKGLNMLFTGPPGTGKTMAAEIIANELSLDLYKIDLSQVVSKYIGETEKNLNRIFSEARTSNAILFFDEADALFGKRSEVKDAHDRYANIEIGYLLQKMEEYDGVSILTTNLRKNMDEAFVRRLQYSVEFPFPDESHRKRIWQTIFPDEAPKSSDIDYWFLARRFKISGGNIKNIILTAAFFAARNSRVIGMKHLILATKREMQKMGRLCTKTDFGEYYDLIA